MYKQICLCLLTMEQLQAERHNADDIWIRINLVFINALENYMNNICMF